MNPAFRIVLLVCLFALNIATTGAQEAKLEDQPDRVASYYFGNSLTGCSDPKWHKEFGASAGKEWETWAFLGAGWQLWQHRHALQNAGVDMQRDDNGDLTIDPDLIQGGLPWNVKQFYESRWDAIVLQPFSMALTWKCDSMWGVEFDKETDVGDIASASDIIEIYLALNPQGKVHIYQDWPAMKAGKVPPPDQLPEWAKKPNARLKGAEFPLRDEFDYEQAWAQAKYEPSPDPDRVWFQKNARSRDYHTKLFAALKERFPKLLEEGRLRVIPVGDIFLALHRKMKAGEFPGCTDIEEYYTDVQHIRGGLPRYTVAAAFYAGLFNEHPGKLDWTLYNSLERYQAGHKGPDDPSHDRGELLDITPERAKIVNDTIWQVTTSHPDARPARQAP